MASQSSPLSARSGCQPVPSVARSRWRHLDTRRRLPNVCAESSRRRPGLSSAYVDRKSCTPLWTPASGDEHVSDQGRRRRSRSTSRAFRADLRLGDEHSRAAVGPPESPTHWEALAHQHRRHSVGGRSRLAPESRALAGCSGTAHITNASVRPPPGPQLAGVGTVGLSAR